MLLTTAAFILALSGGTVTENAPPVMRVPVAGLRLSEQADAAVFVRRLADESQAFCAVHRDTVTPQHVGNPRFCERGMAREAVRALPPARRTDFYRAGGRRMLTQAQR